MNSFITRKSFLAKENPTDSLPWQYKLTDEQLDKLAEPNLNPEQLEFICCTIGRIRFEQLYLLANPRFSIEQMETLRREILFHHPPTKLVATMANPDFSIAQMEEICFAFFHHHLPIAQIKKVAKPEISADEMWHKFRDLRR